MQDPHLTVTTLSGERVAAPIHVWLQELVLMLPPDDLVALMARVGEANRRHVIPASGAIPADPAAYLNRDGTPRRQSPRRT